MSKNWAIIADSKKIKAEHPDWTEEQVKEEYSRLSQIGLLDIMKSRKMMNDAEYIGKLAAINKSYAHYTAALSHLEQLK